MIKRFLVFIVLVALCVNIYYTKRLVKFAKESSEYFVFLRLKTDCLEVKSGLNEMDARLASFGQRRDHLKGKERLIFPPRDLYDVQDEKCNKYAKYMCWVIDPKDPANLDNCTDRLLVEGYTKEQIEQIKKKKSFKDISPK